MTVLMTNFDDSCPNFPTFDCIYHDYSKPPHLYMMGAHQYNLQNYMHICQCLFTFVDMSSIAHVMIQRMALILDDETCVTFHYPK